jgi:hypothetical protein
VSSPHYRLVNLLQILKFCFYVFDKDKNGFIEEDELKLLLALLHDNQHERGNLGIAIKKVYSLFYGIHGLSSLSNLTSYIKLS